MPPERPASATHAAVGWSGAICMLLAVTVLNFWQPVHQIAYLALIVMAVSALGVFVPDLLWQKVQRRTLVTPATASPAAGWSRSLTKLIGLLGSVGFIALLYWLFPEYASAGFYANYWQALRVVLPLWALVSLPYIYWVDQRLLSPCDALWQMGRLLTLRWHDVSGRVIGQHLLGWLVKGYYLPLMFTYFCENLDKLLHYDLNRLHGFKGCFDWAFFTMYFIDVALVSMTYLMSLKLTDTHIRSTEPTMLGWITALVCYEPFWSLIGAQYLAYDTGRGWEGWFANTPWLYEIWGCLILLLVAIYVWSTIAFGARFSNLTHRGIITNGPYRYSKHPAYLSKNLSWWLISIPFMLSVNLAQSLRGCVLLCMLNGIYYLRAKTEERHLSLDPIFQEYARWIEFHGLLRGLNRLPGIGALARWRPSFRAYSSPARFTPGASP
ncbi:MAG TPA: isoprenylcysteine carboxylmethyltransferase family protein [Steroidobacteraceae bacterium]